MSPQKRTVVLGAGFSRAISEHMPLTDELGASVGDRLALSEDPRLGAAHAQASFEQWLSHLADEQPFLTTQENLENRALFLRVSEAVAEVLGERQHLAMLDGVPDWLRRLVVAAHWSRSTLVTFNYDTLIEWVATQHSLCDPTTHRSAAWTEITGNVPNWPPGDMRWGADPADTLRLLKLHGSLNWYWSPGDVTGVSVARRVLPMQDDLPVRYTEVDRRRDLPGRVPLVIPPASTKSAFYANPFMHEVWSQAYAALRDADRVSLIGYSLPVTDLTVADLLRSSLVAGQTPITIADLAASDVARRLTDLGISPGRIRTFDGAPVPPVEAFVDEWINELSADMVTHLETLDDAERDDPMLVVWGEQCMAAVTAVTVAGAVATLTVDAPMPMGAATRSRDGVLSLAKLADVLRQGITRMTVTSDRTPRQTVVASSTHRLAVGYGHGRWHTLFTDGVSGGVAGEN